MKLPLYDPASAAAPKTRPAAGNIGLWFDKFCNQWCRNTQKQGLEAWSLKACSIGQGKNRVDINPKTEWIRTVTDKPVGNQDLLAEHAARIANLASALGGQTFRFTNTSRFATGLGREHPVENGFAWHPSLGVPYLAGSSVKGLVRSWVENGWSENTIDPSTFHRIFGSDYRKGSNQYDHQRNLSPQSGTVIFLDAIPAETVQLKADVMTPHYSDYYENGAVPGDWLSPNPIPFLTVGPDQRFQFALLPRTPANIADVAIAASWLAEALQWLGAGAKTAVGYGRFAITDPVADASVQSKTSPPVELRPIIPKHKPGQQVTARRVIDPKGKGRIWFQADDGFGGVVTSGNPPPAEIDQPVELEIASVNQGIGYNFRVPRPASSPQTQKTTRSRR